MCDNRAKEVYSKHELNHDVRSKCGESPVGNPEIARDKSPVSTVTAKKGKNSVGCVTKAFSRTFSGLVHRQTDVRTV